MNKSDIIEYIEKTPENVNPTIVGQMVDEVAASSGGKYAPSFINFENAPENLIYETSHLDIRNIDNSYLEYAFSFAWDVTDIDVSEWDVSNRDSIQGFFCQAKKIKEIDVSNWDVSNVSNFKAVFSECEAVTELKVDNWDTSAATDISGMFEYCKSLETINVSNFDTSNVTDMGTTFRGCEKLTEINLSNWDTSSVTDMGGMFEGCKLLEEIDISNFDGSSIEIPTSVVASHGTGSMFYDCTALETIIINNPNVFPMTNVSMLANTTCNVYVPDNLVDTYKAADNWSTYASRIKPLSELPTA